MGGKQWKRGAEEEKGGEGGVGTSERDYEW